MANLQDIVNRSEVGAIKPWTKATAPAGYVLCDGSAISRTDYADLFAVISTTYGVGNGSTTFNVPDLKGKMPQGYESGNYALAGTGGADTVTVSVTNNQGVSLTNNQTVTVTGSIDNTSLTTAQLATHYHGLGRVTTGPPPNNNIRINYRCPRVDGLYIDRAENDCHTCANYIWTCGSGTGHNHSHTLAGTLAGTITGTLSGAVTASGTNSFSPYVVVNYIIKH